MVREQSRSSSWVTWVWTVTLVASAGCGRASSASGGAGSSGGEGSLTVTMDPANGETFAREDRVSAGDAPAPDGRPDPMFTVHVRGRFNGMILTVCEDPTTHTGTQWDTIVGQDPIPEGFRNRFGAQTWVLGVMGPDGRMLNNGNGSLPEQNFERMTTLRLFVSQRDTLQSGRTVCLTVLRPEGEPARTSVDVR